MSNQYEFTDDLRLLNLRKLAANILVIQVGPQKRNLRQYSKNHENLRIIDKVYAIVRRIERSSGVTAYLRAATPPPFLGRLSHGPHGSMLRY